MTPEARMKALRTRITDSQDELILSAIQEAVLEERERCANIAGEWYLNGTTNPGVMSHLLIADEIRKGPPCRCFWTENEDGSYVCIQCKKTQTPAHAL